jgi:membrane protein
MTSIVSALNKAYDLPETRPWWKVRLVAIGSTARSNTLRVRS